MSIEASVEELYGDSKDDNWKREEIARLKAEQGVVEMEEPGINLDAGGFQADIGGGEKSESQSSKPDVRNEPGRIPGSLKNSK